MKFIFDTGASTVNISMAEAIFLFKNGHIQEADIKGTSHAQIANGEIVENTRILLHKIDIGGIEINDVDATVSHNLNAPLLLGQSAINKLGAIQLDGTNLIIKGHKSIGQQNDNTSNLFHLGLFVLIIVVISYLIYSIFSKFKGNHYISETDNLGSTSSKRNNKMGISSKLAWFKSRQYILYITYCFMLLLSIVVIELHIDNKQDRLYSELIGRIQDSFGGFNQNLDALDFERIDELEYKEVSIPELITDENNTTIDKRKRKRWNNIYSGIEHVYKITYQGWQMAGMQFTHISNNGVGIKNGIQDYYYFPFMICVPDGLEFNIEIAKNILEKSLDKVYCKPDQYNTANEIKSTPNEYFHLVGNTFFQDSLPKLSMHFYDETTGTDPIYDGNKFTGYYWFGMHKVGQYRVIFAYQNSFSWRIEEKEGFNASTKDRVIYYSIVLVFLTGLLLLILYNVKHYNRNITSV